MELLSTWRTLFKLRYCPVTLIQTAFSAGTVYLLIAMQAGSGPRTAQKELRHSLHQETLVQQYLQEIGLSWNCAAKISDTLRSLSNEHVRPLLDSLDRKSIPNATAGLHISADTGDDNEESDSRVSRSSSRKRSFITMMKPRQVSRPPTISSEPGQSSLSTLPEHILTSSTSNQVPPSLAEPSNSFSITISSACDASPTHASPSAPITISSQRSNPFSFSDSWNFQPSPGSSPNFNYLPSFVHRGFQDHSQPFSNYTDNPFSGNSHGGSEDVGHAFGGQGSAHNIQSSSSSSSMNHYVGGYLAMLGGQTLSEAPFVGLFNEVDTHSPNFSNHPFGSGFLNHGSASGEHVPSSSYGDNDSMDLDNTPWSQSFPS